MKKLLLFPLLFFVINLGATATEVMQSNSPTNEQAEGIFPIKTDVEESLFLLRHADKLKKFAYATDIILPLSMIGSIMGYQFYDYINNESLRTGVGNLTFFMIGSTIVTLICKIISDPLVKYAMTQKYMHDLKKASVKSEMISSNAQANEQKENTQSKTEVQALSFLVTHVNTLKNASYVTDFILPVCFAGFLISLIHNISSPNGHISDATIYLFFIAVATFICKFITDPAAKYAMSLKIAYLEEQLKKSQDKKEMASE